MTTPMGLLLDAEVLLHAAQRNYLQAQIVAITAELCHIYPQEQLNIKLSPPKVENLEHMASQSRLYENLHNAIIAHRRQHGDVPLPELDFSKIPFYPKILPPHGFIKGHLLLFWRGAFGIISKEKLIEHFTQNLMEEPKE